MCLAVPMRVCEIYNDGSAMLELDGASCKASLSLLDDVKKGDFVIVHAGFAIEKVHQKEADERIQLFRELAEIQREHGI